MKRFLLIIVLFSALMSHADAQVILMDSDESRARVSVEGEAPFIPLLGVTYDQYAPVSDGAVLLCCLGATYLLKKKRKMR